MLDVSGQILSCHSRKAKKHEAYQKLEMTVQHAVHMVIKNTFRKKGLLTARIAELI